jgi:hypothetical protein
MRYNIVHVLHAEQGIMHRSAQRSAFTEKAVLGERLIVIISPRGEVRIGIRFVVRVDIVRGWEVCWVAICVDGIAGLVHADPVDGQRRREGQMVEIDVTEVLRDSEVNDDVHGLLGDGSC